MNTFLRLLLLSLTSIFFVSCLSGKPPLRVGVSANYPPIIFKTDYGFSGLETDFAKELGKELGREIEFVEVNWSSIISALNSNKIDIIMSGMSVTKNRAHYVKFLPSYMSISQMLLVRRNQMAQFRKPGNGYYLHSNFIVGVSSGTTGEAVAKKHLPNNRIVRFDTVKHGVAALKNGKVDCYLHDSPTIWSYADGSDPQIAGVYWDFTKEHLAWGVKQSNQALYSEVNQVFKKWKLDGTLSKILFKWVPNRINYK